MEHDDIRVTVDVQHCEGTPVPECTQMTPNGAFEAGFGMWRVAGMCTGTQGFQNRGWGSSSQLQPPDERMGNKVPLVLISPAPRSSKAAAGLVGLLYRDGEVQPLLCLCWRRLSLWSRSGHGALGEGEGSHPSPFQET